MLFVLFIRTSALLTVTAQKNLTPYGKATQSSLYSIGKPENAINQPESNEWGWNKCTHTSEYRSPSWWMFTFYFGYAFISDIKIYYRDNFAHRMDGFKLYVTNTSTITATTSYLCYQDPDPGTPNITQTISCNQIGQYVIYYDDKIGKGDHGSIIELCYVAINGCQKGFWGSDCAKPCAANCIERHCYLGNGACVWGCNSGNCLNDKCDRHTSVCTDGCKKRRTGKYCDKYNVASDGSVLQSPSGSENAMVVNDGNITSCSKTLGNEIWYQVDLKEKGFVTGIYLTFGECSTGQFGKNCLEFCTGYVSNMCEPFDGLCYNTSACNAGYKYEKYCNDECENGNFGDNCTRTCYCLTTPCNTISGKCPPGGCAKGWNGKSCEERIALQTDEPSNTAIICGSAATVMFIVIIVVVAFIIYKGRLRAKKEDIFTGQTQVLKLLWKETNSENGQANVNITAMSDTVDVTLSLGHRNDSEAHIVKNDDLNVYYNVPSEHNVSKYKILIRDLKEAIKQKQRDNCFKTEYEILPRGLVYAHVEGSKEENKVKNRFLTTWPYICRRSFTSCSEGRYEA